MFVKGTMDVTYGIVTVLEIDVRSGEAWKRASSDSTTSFGAGISRVQSKAVVLERRVVKSDIPSISDMASYALQRLSRAEQSEWATLPPQVVAYCTR